MSLHAVSYLLPEDFDLEGLKAALAEAHSLGENPSSNLEQTYYDSFDWRVWLAGAELLHEEDEQGRLCWSPLNEGCTPQLCQPMAQKPEFAEDLPPGPVTEHLAKVLEMRVLLPKLIISQTRQNIALLDSEEKTVVRVAWVSSEYHSINRKQSGPLDTLLMVMPLRGYEAEFEKVIERLQAFRLSPCDHSLFRAAMGHLGIKPGDYTSKLNYNLDPDARSDATAKRILLGLLDTLEANVAGAKANLDSEFLHDLRVATRRTRSAMSQIKGAFDPQELETFKQGFAWIGQITGQTRDLDVYLLQYNHYRTSLPAAVRPDLDPFHDYLIRHHKSAHARLVKKLNSPHFRKILKSWRDFLEAPLSDQPKGPNAKVPAAELADRRIGKLYSKILQQGAAIGPNSPGEQMHELRKQCKKLRYMMEFFQSLYPKPEIRHLIKLLKVLLDNLGEFQDLEVQAHSLEGFGSEMLKEGAPASALMAMGILVGKLYEKQALTRRAFAQLFTEFSSSENEKAFRKLFGGA
ncbi:MAG: CHAD domain-containing protein [Candidatus Thiodiazotropha sp.]